MKESIMGIERKMFINFCFISLLVIDSSISKEDNEITSIPSEIGILKTLSYLKFCECNIGLNFGY